MMHLQIQGQEDGTKSNSDSKGKNGPRKHPFLRYKTLESIIGLAKGSPSPASFIDKLIVDCRDGRNGKGRSGYEVSSQHGPYWRQEKPDPYQNIPEERLTVVLEICFDKLEWNDGKGGLPTEYVEDSSLTGKTFPGMRWSDVHEIVLGKTPVCARVRAHWLQLKMESLGHAGWMKSAAERSTVPVQVENEPVQGTRKQQVDAIKLHLAGITAILEAMGDE